MSLGKRLGQPFESQPEIAEKGKLGAGKGDRILDRAAGLSYDSAMTECSLCRQALDPTDRFCRSCGTPVGATRGLWPFRRPAPSPEQAASYWRHFFRPFFITAFIFFGAFFFVALIMVGVWFFMFRQ